MYTLGPCPVAAVKKGICTVKYDTAFVFSEVNADEVHWELLPGGGEKQLDLFKSKYGAPTVNNNKTKTTAKHMHAHTNTYTNHSFRVLLFKLTMPTRSECFVYLETLCPTGISCDVGSIYRLIEKG